MLDDEDEMQYPPLADPFLDVDPLQIDQPSVPAINHEFDTHILDYLALPEVLEAPWDPLSFYSAVSNDLGPSSAADASIFASHELTPFGNDLDRLTSQFTDEGYACFADDFDTT